MYREYYVTSDDARLYCRRYGNGKPMVLMHGACVDSDFFSDLAHMLAEHFSVITFDRRGYSRSSSPEDHLFSIPAQARDAAAVIRSVGEPCNVLAHSAATVIGMELAVRNPELLNKLLLYEAPIAECLPLEHEALPLLSRIMEMVRSGKYQRALNLFLPLIGPADRRAPSEKQRGFYDRKNSIHFMMHEFYQVFYYHPDYQGLAKGNVTVGVGELSADTHHGPIAAELARRTGAQLLYFPGRHNAPHDLPKEFAYMLTGLFTLPPQSP